MFSLLHSDWEVPLILFYWSPGRSEGTKPGLGTDFSQQLLEATGYKDSSTSPKWLGRRSLCWCEVKGEEPFLSFLVFGSHKLPAICKSSLLHFPFWIPLLPGSCSQWVSKLLNCSPSPPTDQCGSATYIESYCFCLKKKTKTKTQMTLVLTAFLQDRRKHLQRRKPVYDSPNTQKWECLNSLKTNSWPNAVLVSLVSCFPSPFVHCGYLPRYLNWISGVLQPIGSIQFKIKFGLRINGQKVPQHPFLARVEDPWVLEI